MSLFLAILPTLFPLISLFGCYVLILSFGHLDTPLRRQIFLSILFALAMCLILAWPFTISSGVILDSRGAVLAAAMLFGGPWVGMVTALTGMLYRLYLGGAGAWAGLWGLALNAGGILLYFRWRRSPLPTARRPFLWLLLMAGAWGGLCEALSLFLVTPYAYGLQLALQMGWVLGLFQLASMLALGCLMYLYQQNWLLQHELSRSEAERLWMADHAAEIVAVFGEKNTPLYVSTSTQHILGSTPDIALREQINPQDLQLLDQELARLREGAIEHSQFNLAITDALGQQHPVEASLSRLTGPDLHIMLMLRDQSAMRQATQDMEASERKFRGIFNQAAVGMALVSPQGRWLQVNQRLCEIVGYSEEELLQLGFQDITHPDDLDTDIQQATRLLTGEDSTYTLEKRYVRKDGSLIWIELTVSLVRDQEQKPDFFISVINDINQRKYAEAQILNLAYYDTLTKLPNRRMLQDRIERARISSARSNEWCAIFLLDLDYFKNLNDTQGHDAGDQLLIQVAQRLLAELRSADTVARLGGDEFVILLENLGGAENLAAQQAEALAEKLRDSINQPFTLKAEPSDHYHTSSSIGISLFQGKVLSLEDILKHADIALYQAKENGRNTIRFFDKEIQYAMEIRTRLQAALHNGLKRGEFQIFCQAQVDGQGRKIGGEILLRWKHADAGWVSPAQFIPLAEETGAIHEIGLWVLLKSCEILAAWQKIPQLAQMNLSVNVSVRQFRKNDFVANVKQILDMTGVHPARLKLELTESIFAVKETGIAKQMQDLCAQGITFALDDFGTGYSSLAYLKHLPFQQIKIDQSFVQGIPEAPDNMAIVQAILLMGHSLGMEVIAEGVETEAQRQFLLRHGCTAFQGYLFARPIPLEQFAAQQTAPPEQNCG